MGIKVSDGILKRTTKCEKLFVCLSGRNHDICEAERYLGSNGVLQIRLKNENACSYHILLDDLDYCTCPVRIELHKSHGI
jgi:hypothetical protein